MYMGDPCILPDRPKRVLSGLGQLAGRKTDKPHFSQLKPTYQTGGLRVGPTYLVVVVKMISGQ